MGTIRHSSLFFLGAVLQAVAVEARRKGGGGGGGGGGGSGSGSPGGATVGIVVGAILGMCAPSQTKFLHSDRNVSRCFNAGHRDTQFEEVASEAVGPTMQSAADR